MCVEWIYEEIKIEPMIMWSKVFFKPKKYRDMRWESQLGNYNHRIDIWRKFMEDLFCYYLKNSGTYFTSVFLKQTFSVINNFKNSCTYCRSIIFSLITLKMHVQYKYNLMENL